MRTALRYIERQFFTGLLILVPTWGTVLILGTLFSTLDQLLGTVFGELAVTDIPGIGLISLIVLIVLAGILATLRMARITTSMLPPAGNDTTMVTGPAG